MPRSGGSFTALTTLRCAQLQQLEVLFATPTAPQTLSSFAHGRCMTSSEAVAATAWARTLIRLSPSHPREPQKIVDARVLR